MGLFGKKKKEEDKKKSGGMGYKPPKAFEPRLNSRNGFRKTFSGNVTQKKLSLKIAMKL